MTWPGIDFHRQHHEQIIQHQEFLKHIDYVQWELLIWGVHAAPKKGFREPMNLLK